jgi:glycosyltransferase involved in cell wall biosynthesis
MDLVAEMLVDHLRAEHADTVEAVAIRPKLKRRFKRLPVNGELADKTHNADRLVNRFWDYPRLLSRSRNDFDLFHIVDHSYAQLVHKLPSERTIVTCHDLDTFRCVLEPEVEPRSKAFIAMTRKILDGLRKAERVTCDSEATRDELVKFGIVPAARAIVVQNGVHPTCSPDPDADADAEAVRLLGPQNDDGMDLLHVGSTIPRKRIDVLLNVFAEVKKEYSNARLIRAGGAFTPPQRDMVARLGLADSIVELPSLSRPVLAAVYRRAALVLQPSEREGFGLPVVEAMACGVPVIASELDVLREVGGSVATYCPVANVPSWRDAVVELLQRRAEQPQKWEELRAACLGQAGHFTWSGYAGKMLALYRELW